MPRMRYVKCNAWIRMVVLASLLSLGACSTPYFEPVSPPDANTSVIYLYRLKADNPGLQPLRFSYPEIFMDDKSIGFLKYETRLMVTVTPGKHHFRVTGLTRDARWEPRDIHLDFTARPGETQYLKLDVQYNLSEMNLGQPGAKYLIFLTPVNSNDAVYEIRYTQPSL
ncbi:MAG TPA: hypothetical protein VIM96_11230 [Pseudomonadales bacterium]